MSPNLLVVFLHLGSVLKTVKDVEQCVADLIQGKNASQDAKVVLQDLLDLFNSGVLKIPGMSAEQNAAMIADLSKVIAGAPAGAPAATPA